MPFNECPVCGSYCLRKGSAAAYGLGKELFGVVLAVCYAEDLDKDLLLGQKVFDTIADEDRAAMLATFDRLSREEGRVEKVVVEGASPHDNLWFNLFESTHNYMGMPIATNLFKPICKIALDLSPQQRKAVRLLPERIPIEEISAEVGAKPATIRTHLDRAMFKVGVRSHFALARWASNNEQALAWGPEFDDYLERRKSTPT